MSYLGSLLIIINGLFLGQIGNTLKPFKTDKQNGGDTIKWSPDYKLNMGDFKKSTIGNTTLRHDSSNYRLLAFSSVAIGYSFKMVKGKTLFDAFALFVKSRSWMKAPDESVLKHEQGHFVIGNNRLAHATTTH